MMIDTHTHLYDEQFDEDRPQTLERAIQSGVGRFALPAIDSLSHEALFAMVRTHPERCFPLMGLHPTSVNDNPLWSEELARVEQLLSTPPEGVRFVGVGEVGLDLYWSRDYLREQCEALRFQLELALQHDLPVVFHTRDAWAEMIELVVEFRGRGLRGVFHSFSGTEAELKALEVLGDFLYGIGGPLTYKRSTVAELLPQIGIERIVLETDSPYLPPTPHRGKRNESAYLPLVRDRVAQLLGLTPEQVAHQTTLNAERLFSI